LLERPLSAKLDRPTVQVFLVDMSKNQTPPAWPVKEHRTGSDAQLHAMGQISLIYNELEEWLSFLFEQLFPASLSASKSLYNRLNNRDRVDLLTATVEVKEEDEILRDHILWALRCFDICNANRNTLLHARSEYYRNAKTFRLLKQARDDPTVDQEYPLRLSELRSVADDMARTLDFMVNLHAHIHDLRPPPNAILGPKPEPLPRKPSKPKRLIPRRG
jgi:hypothetical protein